MVTGIVTPLATPLTPDGDAIDAVGTRRLLDHVISGGVAGVFVLGSTGEGPSLSPKLRTDFVTLCCRLVREIVAAKKGGEGPDDIADNFRILVGVSDTCIEGTVSLAAHAAKCGADAVVIASPYYFPITQAELKNYVHHVAKHTELPIFLYNMPALTKVTFEIETVRELAKEFGDKGRIMGIKDSSFDLEYIAQLCDVKKELCPSWSILTGAEWHVAQVVRMGGDGGVVGGSNAFPAAFVSFYQGAATGDKTMQDEAFKKIQRLKAIYDMANGRFVQATKTSLSVLGICEASYALPLLPYGAEERSLVENVIADIKAMDAE